MIENLKEGWKVYLTQGVVHMTRRRFGKGRLPIWLSRLR